MDNLTDQLADWIAALLSQQRVFLDNSAVLQFLDYISEEEICSPNELYELFTEWSSDGGEV